MNNKINNNSLRVGIIEKKAILGKKMADILVENQEQFIHILLIFNEEDYNDNIGIPTKILTATSLELLQNAFKIYIEKQRYEEYDNGLEDEHWRDFVDEAIFHTFRETDICGDKMLTCAYCTIYKVVPLITKDDEENV